MTQAHGSRLRAVPRGWTGGAGIGRAVSRGNCCQSLRFRVRVRYARRASRISLQSDELNVIFQQKTTVVRHHGMYTAFKSSTHRRRVYAVIR